MLAAALSLFFAVCAAALPSGSSPAALHESRSANFTLSKRYSNARWTFYTPGLGACGKNNGDGDFIVALNIEQWNGGSHCFDEITMSYGGKTTSAQIVDLCPGCPQGGLDLSPSLFSFFASQDLGVIQGSWNFGGSSGGSSGGNGGNSEATSSKKPAPAPAPATTKVTHAPAPTPTPTSTPAPKPSSTQQASPSSSSSSAAPSSSAAATSVTATSSTPAAIPSNPLYSTITSDNTNGTNGTISQIYLAVVQLALLSQQA